MVVDEAALVSSPPLPDYTFQVAYFGPETLTTREQVEQRISDVLLPAPVIAIDVETVSLKDRRIMGIGIAVSPTEAFYFPWNSSIMPWEKTTRPGTVRIFHNSLFDLPTMNGSEVLRFQDVETSQGQELEDTAIMGRFANFPFVDMQYLSMVLLGREAHDDMGKVLRDRKLKTTLELSPNTIAEKCCKDAQVTFEFWLNLQGDKGREHGSQGRMECPYWYYRREMQLIPVLVRMGRRGLHIDQERRATLETHHTMEASYYEEICLSLTPRMNPHSPFQVAYTLSKNGAWLPRNKSGRGLATDERTLKKVQHPLADVVLQARHHRKLVSTYLKPMRGQDRATTRFNLDARTGRISSAAYNMTNIPPATRVIFTGDFVDLDASQLELRVLGYFSHDPVMGQVFDRGESIHKHTTISVHGPGTYSKEDRRYKTSKNGNFATIYGADIPTLVDTVGFSEAEAKAFLEGWKRTYPVAWRWIEEQGNEALRTGYVETMQGRRIRLQTDMESEGGIRRKGVNYPIQASAGEVLREIILATECDSQVLEVHDEVLWAREIGDFPFTLEQLESDLPFVTPQLRTPVEVRTFSRWGE